MIPPHNITTLKASRPDITPAEWKAFDAQALSFDRVKAIVDATPPRNPLALGLVVPTLARPPLQGRMPGLPADVASMDPKIARAMRLLPDEPVTDPSGTIHYMGHK